MDKDGHEKWINSGRRRPFDRENKESPGALYLHLSNERYATKLTFEERLTFQDRQMLKDMGILV
jgi:hypothetical protein